MCNNASKTLNSTLNPNIKKTINLLSFLIKDNNPGYILTAQQKLQKLSDLVAFSLYFFSWRSEWRKSQSSRSHHHHHQIGLTSVCSSWRRILMDYIPTSEAITWLIFPSNLHPDGASDGCRFYSLGERKFYFQKNSVFKDFGKRHLYWFISRMARSLRWNSQSFSFESLLLYPDSPSSPGNSSGCCVLFRIGLEKIAK